MCPQRKGGNTDSMIVHKKLIKFLAETDMSKYEFSKRSGIPRSTLRSILKNPDYNIGENNIFKIITGMGIEPPELFMGEGKGIFVIRIDEVKLLELYRKSANDEKIRILAYTQACYDHSSQVSE